MAKLCSSIAIAKSQGAKLGLLRGTMGMNDVHAQRDLLKCHGCRFQVVGITDNDGGWPTIVDIIGKKY